jgi:hypothetical protein
VCVCEVTCSGACQKLRKHRGTRRRGVLAVVVVRPRCIVEGSQMKMTNQSPVESLARKGKPESRQEQGCRDSFDGLRFVAMLLLWLLKADRKIAPGKADG